MKVLEMCKNSIKKHPQIIKAASLLVNHFPLNNKYQVKKRAGIIIFNNSFIRKTKIVVKGYNNKIIFNDKSIMYNCNFFINGDNNMIIVNDNAHITNGELWIEDDNNTISIGSRTLICGKTHLACIEGSKIIIGEDCLFSTDVVFRTGDSHSILDMDGVRCNPSEDIVIGNHVWFGNKTIITKGVTIKENSIISTGAIVTKKFEIPNVIIGGIPAKIIKRNINWNLKRI